MSSDVPNENIRKRTEKVQVKEVIKTHFQDYCGNTTLHGLQYLGEKGRPWFEKFFWFVILLLCLIVNGYFIINLIIKWKTSPVILTFAELTTPVWNIPFPAITICDETKFLPSLLNYTYLSRLYEEKDDILLKNKTLMKNFGYMKLVCDSFSEQKDDSFGQDYLDVIDFDEFMAEVSPTKDLVIEECLWRQSNDETFESLFDDIITDDGLCYTFNILDINKMFTDDSFLLGPYPQLNLTDDWDMETGYKPDVSIKSSHPRRTWSAGLRGGLYLQMRTNVSQYDYLCRGPTLGYKIALHHPGELPSMEEKFFRVPINQEVTIAITPNIITTDENLRSYSPHQRNCYFQSERQLTYFDFYTETNCELDCLTKYALKKCGCVMYYMPVIGNTTTICAVDKTHCIKEAEDEIRISQVERSLKQQFDDLDDIFCDCLPSCTSIEYNAELTQVYYDWNDYYRYDEDFEPEPGIAKSRVNIFYKSLQFITSRRSELYGFVDVFGNAGGLTGVFSGFSFLSLIELFYFLFIRIWKNEKLKKLYLNDKKQDKKS